MKDLDFTYLDGLHRPYNMPLKGIVWVCCFIKYIEDNNLSIAVSHFYVEFFKFHLDQILKHNAIEEDKYKGVISKTKAKIVLHWLQGKKDINEIETAISDILQQRCDEEERIVYSTYKNTSYYITLAKKFDYISSSYELTLCARDLIKYSKRFYTMSNQEKDNLFMHIVSCDTDVFLPLLFSLPFKRKCVENTEDLHLIYLEQYCHVSYFNYVKKSQSSNYDKVRLAWIKDLKVVDKYFRIKKHYVQLLEKSDYSNKYLYYKESVHAFLYEFVNLSRKRDLLYQKVEDAYSKMIELGKHDLGFVNLYDIKSEVRLSFGNFEKMINAYYNKHGKLKLVLFSNIVSSIDTRKRFIINRNPVIKIRIVKK